MAMLDSQRYPLSSYLFNIVEDIVYFLGFMNTVHFPSVEMCVTFLEKPQFTRISFENDKYLYLVHTSSAPLWIKQLKLCVETRDYSPSCFP